MTVSEWLKAHRERNGLSQQQLASLTNCSLSSIRAWERGKCEPSAPMIARLFGRLTPLQHLEMEHLEAWHNGKDGAEFEYWISKK